MVEFLYLLNEFHVAVDAHRAVDLSHFLFSSCVFMIVFSYLRFSLNIIRG